ncbi:MAG TPA: hypothetical protein VFD47_00190 [Actinomycetota bacterium]|nr:hypothetical protein [Actinomycetota bacterium]
MASASGDWLRTASPAGFDKPTLFEPFRRGPGVDAPGVGLGLFIAARLAASLGGSVDVVETAGLVTFNVMFPIGERRAGTPKEAD